MSYRVAVAETNFHRLLMGANLPFSHPVSHAPFFGFQFTRQNDIPVVGESNHKKVWKAWKVCKTTPGDKTKTPWRSGLRSFMVICGHWSKNHRCRPEVGIDWCCDACDVTWSVGTSLSLISKAAQVTPPAARTESAPISKSLNGLLTRWDNCQRSTELVNYLPLDVNELSHPIVTSTLTVHPESIHPANLTGLLASRVLCVYVCVCVYIVCSCL